MAELARAHVIERFTAARMAADFMRLYDALVPQAR
jgi:hypothetical protein